MVYTRRSGWINIKKIEGLAYGAITAVFQEVAVDHHAACLKFFG